MDQAPRQTAPETAPEAATAAPPRSRARRWLRRGLFVCLGLVLLLTLAIGGALFAVDTDAGRDFLVAKVEGATSLQVHYESLEVSLFSGVRARGLRLRAPDGPWLGYEPDVATVDVLDVGWDAGALLTASLVVEHVTLQGVRAAVVQTADGQTSLEAALAGLASDDEEPPEPSAPLSQTLANLVLPDLEVREVMITGISARYLVLGTDEKPYASYEAGDLAIAGHASVEDGAFVADLRLTPAGEAVALTVDQRGADGALQRQGLLASLDHQIKATSADGLTTRLDLDLISQTFFAWGWDGRVASVGFLAHAAHPRPKWPCQLIPLHTTPSDIPSLQLPARDVRLTLVCFCRPAIRVLTCGTAHSRQWVHAESSQGAAQ